MMKITMDQFKAEALKLGAKVKDSYGTPTKIEIDPKKNPYSKRVAEGVLAVGKGKLEQTGKVSVETKNLTGAVSKKRHAWSSMPEGGCGLSTCRCSPGLWISAAEGDRIIIVQFGSGHERGDYAEWSEADATNWSTLREMSGASY